MKDSCKGFLKSIFCFAILSLASLGIISIFIFSIQAEGKNISFAGNSQKKKPGQMKIFTYLKEKPTLDVSVKNPAYPKGEGPAVLFDEGHHNYHKSTGTYKPFVDIITNDGYEVKVNQEKFTVDVLKGFKILVIVSALDERDVGIKNWGPPRYPAFTSSEIEVIHSWIKSGGSIFLITGPPPFGPAAFDLAQKLGITLSQGTVYDPNPRIEFSRENGQLLDHPLTQGRDEGEEVYKVTAFGGEAIEAPEGSGFLKVSKTALSRDPITKEEKPVPGQFRGAAFNCGEGRVVVLGGATMVTARIFEVKPTGVVLGYRLRGINPKKNDNKQLLLNLMHYLSHLINVDKDASRISIDDSGKVEKIKIPDSKFKAASEKSQKKRGILWNERRKKIRSGMRKTPPIGIKQTVDSSFDSIVRRPEFEKGQGPSVLFDEAHMNRHTTTGTYKPFVDVIANDGYVVQANKSKFSKDILKKHNILVISNAKAPITTEESDAIHTWVKEGGSLFLIADHNPYGWPVFNLAKKFGVVTSKGTTYEPEGNNIIYTRENGKLLSHPIIEGRDKNEKVNKVQTFTGQSLQPPKGSGFLKLSEKAYDIVHPATKEKKSAANHFQGAGFAYGKGRVVVLGEAAIVTAQQITLKKPETDEILNIFYVGMNLPNNDNKKLLLNIMHYLSSLMEPGVIVNPADSE